MRWLIYKIINTVNNKIYFGITKRSLKQRFKEHSWNKTSALGRSIRKYGDSLFSIEAIDSAESLKEALAKETSLIKGFQSFKKEIGYNIQIDSMSGETTIDAKINLVLSLKESKKSCKENPYVGVYYNQYKKSWMFALEFNNFNIKCAKFKTPKDAALARDKKIVDSFSSEIALKVMNFPELYEDFREGVIKEPERFLKIALKKSSFKHVSYEQKLNLWRVRFSKSMKPKIHCHHGGLFKLESDAAVVADYCLANSGFSQEYLNFPEKLNEYLSESFSFPQSNLQEKKSIKYSNISLDRGTFRIYIQNKEEIFRPSFKSLKEAIEARNEKLKSLGKSIPNDS
jgi:predicted GIY-YIG superfamily endonuclease